LGIRITNSDGQKILEQKANFDGFGKFAFKILTGTTISINDEGNYELYVVHYGKYGSSAIKKFTVSNDGLPIIIPTVVTPPPTPVPTVVTPPPTPVPTQDPEPFTTSWSMIAGLFIVVAVVGGIIYKKVTGSGFSKISTNYSNTKEEHDNDSSTAEEPRDHSKENKDPMYPTYADLKNNFVRFSDYDMEILTGKLFEAKGYGVEVSPRGNDQKIDVWATTKEGTVIGIQVKHWEDNVGHTVVSEVLGSNLGKCHQYIIISTKKKFTKSAYEHEEQHKMIMKLWDSDRFKEEIKKYLLEKDNSQFYESEPAQKLDFNYYEILGVSHNATPEEIKNNFRKISKNSHPDVNPSSQSETFMKNVNIAYETLKDEHKRRQYDSELNSA